ncbi:MAG: hypothetical protein FWE16_02745 [Firmicutes bacterium]|nr:hypothetical protein [Bacillota bacterium]
MKIEKLVKLATDGDVRAQNELGYYYANKREFKDALKKAAVQGFEDAKEWLEENKF